ncbi:MAG: DUF4168 domain-containing protein [Thiohalorhabdus sp.]|uniref:DUF4168 domain-containing protein n=1 Tax=Thiohalorhabdus sp. TaxID=3094134 RepID=UPI002FC34994
MRFTDPGAGCRLVLLATMLAAAGPANAQAGEGSERKSAAADRVGEDEMAAYVQAARAVRAIRKGETEPVGPAIRRRMVEAVADKGLSLERYNAITRRIRKDEDLYARYQEVWSRD